MRPSLATLALLIVAACSTPPDAATGPPTAASSASYCPAYLMWRHEADQAVALLDAYGPDPDTWPDGAVDAYRYHETRQIAAWEIFLEAAPPGWTYDSLDATCTASSSAPTSRQVGVEPPPRAVTDPTPQSPPATLADPTEALWDDTTTTSMTLPPPTMTTVETEYRYALPPGPAPPTAPHQPDCTDPENLEIRFPASSYSEPDGKLGKKEFTAPYTTCVTRHLLTDPNTRVMLIRDPDYLAPSDTSPYHKGIAEGWLFLNGVDPATGRPQRLTDGGTHEKGGVSGCAGIDLLDDRVRLQFHFVSVPGRVNRGGTVGWVNGRDEWRLEISFGPRPDSDWGDHYRCNSDPQGTGVL